MSRFFYFKLALNNLKRNKTTYIPFIIAGIGMVFTVLVLDALSKNETLRSMRGGESLNAILMLGTIVVIIFSAIFIVYANSFLLKRRKKELGLYAILGLEKKHVTRVLFYENIVVIAASLGLGILFAVVFGKLCFLILLRVLNRAKGFQFVIPGLTIRNTMITFAIIYLATFLLNTIQVRLANPIELLRGEAEGEKPPKVSWLLAILGVFTLGAGYTIAIVVENPISAVTLFFVAVILVIIGTYALFTASSIAILKLLQKNKKFYYKTNNFISVSGMLYRMKQNAAGLANICILCTMVLVMVSGTTALFLGKESTLQKRYPTEFYVTSMEELDVKKLDQLVSDMAKTYGTHVTGKTEYRELTNNFRLDKDQLTEAVYSNEISMSDYKKLVNVEIISLKDYNRIKDVNVQLNGNEILLYTDGTEYTYDHLYLGDKEFAVKEVLKDQVLYTTNEMLTKSFTVVVKDEQVMNMLQEEILTSMYETCYNYYNIEGPTEGKLAFGEDIRDDIREQFDVLSINSKEQSKEEWYSSFGGLLFLGVFLGIVFMMATVLIIYFKQISEGMQDRGRFVIMQKVGLSREEVKKTINKQIRMVFFLPLLTAVMHLAFAFPMICRLLLLFGLVNTMHIFLCTLGCVIAFILIYTAVYHQTAKVYYRLVQQ